MNFQRAAKQGWLAGCRKGWPTLMCSLSAHPNVQSASQPCYAARWPALLCRLPAHPVV